MARRGERTHSLPGTAEDGFGVGAPVPGDAPVASSSWQLASPEERRRRAAAAIALLDEWSQGDEEEQRDTWEKLRRALDEDRLPTNKLFP